jgi:hypothetical protein
MGLFDNTAVSVEMIYQTCITCGVLFGLPANLDAEFRKNHKNFYCPNGHEQHYSGKSEAEKLRDEKVRLQSQLDQSQARADSWRARQEETERSLRSTKGVVTRIKNRVASGKCVCCSRKFPDIGAHMKAEHPDWNADAAPAHV